MTAEALGNRGDSLVNLNMFAMKLAQKAASTSIILIIALLIFNTTAFAAVINVNSTADSLVAGDGQCTIREAINNSNNDNDTTGGDCTQGLGIDTINIPAGTYRITLNGPGDNANLTGDFDITNSVTILGVEGAEAIIQGPNNDRVFDFQAAMINLIMRDLIITDGNATNAAPDNDGGGILLRTGTTFVGERLTFESNEANDHGGGIACIQCTGIDIDDSSFKNNVADKDGTNSGDGGGIYASLQSGIFFLTDSTVGGDTISAQLPDKNSAFNGGGIAVTGNGPIQIIRTTISGNIAANDGGGLYDVKNSGQSLLINSTISGNRAVNDGGGVFVDDSSATSPSVLIESVTITENTADSDSDGNGDGGGISNPDNDIVRLANTIVANNFDSSSRPDCDGSILAFSVGVSNLIGVNAGCEATFPAGNPNANGDFVGTEESPLDPKLTSLALIMPGKTTVHLPEGDSPVIDQGNNTFCAAAQVNNEDQRQVTRPQQFNGVNQCDIGAVELQRFEKLSEIQTVRVSTGYIAPFHCGEERVTFRNDGDKVDSIEFNDTLITITFPESRIVTSVSARDQAQIIQGATINAHSNFLTPGAMSVFVLATLNPGKTYRLNCEDIKRQPIAFQSDGTITRSIVDTQSTDREFFQGVLNIQSTKNLVVQTKRIKRVWFGVPDGGSGVDFKNGKQIVETFDIAGTRTSGSRSVQLYTPAASTPVAATSATSARLSPNDDKRLEYSHRALLGRNSILFRAQGTQATRLDVDVFSLTGRKVFTGRAYGNSLRWNLKSKSGAPLANGIYLYMITIRGADGSIVRSEIKKLVILR